MKIYGWTGIISGLLFILSACNKKEFCDILDAHGSNVALYYDWSAGCCIPGQLEVELENASGDVLTMQTSPQSTYLTLSPGTYQVLAYEKPRNIRIEKGIARLISLPDRTYAQPGDFSAGTGRIEVVENGLCRTSLAMKRQFCQLHLSIEAKGKDAGLVENVGGKLSGVAVARDLRNNCCVQTRSGGDTQTATSVKFDFEQNDGFYTGSVNHLGFINGSRQVISINLTYTDGSRQTVEMDATESVLNPEDETENGLTPQKVTVGLEVEKIKGAITAKITGWKLVEGGNLDAEEN